MWIPQYVTEVIDIDKLCFQSELKMINGGAIENINI